METQAEELKQAKAQLAIFRDLLECQLRDPRLELPPHWRREVELFLTIPDLGQNLLTFWRQLAREYVELRKEGQDLVD